MKRSDAIPYVAHVVDDSGNGRLLGADQHAIVRETKPNVDFHGSYRYASVLVGWNSITELPMFVAVHSYLDVRLDDDECHDLARDYLEEIGFFGCNGKHCVDDGCKFHTRKLNYLIR